MRKRPISFSAAMVRAIEQNRKTMTRRPAPANGDGPRITPGPYWVREPWRAQARFDRFKPSEIPGDALIWYESTGSDGPASEAKAFGRYRHARFMCQWMSKLTIRVHRVLDPERLCSISPADAIREGLDSREIDGHIRYGLPEWEDRLWRFEPVDAFAMVWNGVYGCDAWIRNGLVTPIEFERMPY